MLPAVHFVLSLGIAFCLEYRHRRRFAAILVLGLLGMAPDIDHLLPLYHGARLFHNTLFLGVAPLVMLMAFHLMETRMGEVSSGMQRFSVCAMVILMSHLLLDMISGNAIGFGFPASAGTFRMASSPLLASAHLGTLMVSTDMLWLLLPLLVLSGNMAQKKIYDLYEGYAAERGIGFPADKPDTPFPVSRAGSTF